MAQSHSVHPSSVAYESVWGRWALELRAVYTIWLRDMTHFMRERSRVFGAMAQPLLFWLLIGSGIGSMFRTGGATNDFNYLAFMYPGIIGLTILFTSIFSTISVIADREHGFLREILVSPVARMSVIVGKITAGTTIALLQGVILLAFAPMVGLSFGFEQGVQLVLAMVGMGFALTGIGLSIAWQMSSTQGFHMIMNFFLLPMWLLSGSMFPLEGVPAVLGILMRINPLTYGIDALRAVLVGPGGVGGAQWGYAVNISVILIFAFLIVALAVQVCRSRD